MKYRYILVILIVLILTGCNVDQQGSSVTDTESTDMPVITAERIEQFKNYIDEHHTFDDYLALNVEASYGLYGENYSPLTYKLTYDAKSIKILAQDLYIDGDPLIINTMLLTLDENNDIQYAYAYTFYDFFDYYKGEPLQPYNAYLEYSNDSNNNEWLFLNCYDKYYFQLKYDRTNGDFINADPTSESYGQKMVFINSLSDNISSSYKVVIDNSQIFEVKLKELGTYAKTLFTPQ